MAAAIRGDRAEGASPPVPPKPERRLSLALRDDVQSGKALASLPKAAEPMVTFKPLSDFRERAAEVGVAFAADPQTAEIYWRVIDAIDPGRVAGLQEKYRAELTDFHPAGEFKYADLPYWIAHKAVYVREIGLDRGPPRTILDIGMGAGHFAAVCQALGHTVVGTDIAVPVYDDICAALSVDRRIEPTKRREPLPGLGVKFDFVTVIWQVFHIVSYLPDGNREHWSTDDWRFFLKDIIEHHMRFPGVIFIELNANKNAKGESFDASLMEWSLERGARIDETRGRILFDKISGPRVPRKGQKAAEGAGGIPPLARPATPRLDPRHPSVDLAKRLDAELTVLHRGRLAELGPTASGLYVHYQTILERGSLVGRREAEALYLIDADLPAYDAYAVLRAGLGELALLVAAGGRKVIACEPDLHRRTAICAGLNHLEHIGLISPGALTVLPTLAPQGPLEGRVLGMGLDVVHVRDEAAAAALMAQMRVFDALLVDLRLFLRFREQPQDKALAVAGLQGVGFERRRDFVLAGGLAWFSRAETQLLEAVGGERAGLEDRGTQAVNG